MLTSAEAAGAAELLLSVALPVLLQCRGWAWDWPASVCLCICDASLGRLACAEEEERSCERCLSSFSAALLPPADPALSEPPKLLWGSCQCELCPLLLCNSSGVRDLCRSCGLPGGRCPSSLTLLLAKGATDKDEWCGSEGLGSGTVSLGLVGG